MTLARSPLVGVEDLAAALPDLGIVVLDIRSAVDGGRRAAFEAGHVPGAVHTDYVADGWRVVRDGGAGMLPEPDQLSELFARLGIQPQSHVIVVPAGVSAGDFAAASRIYWTLKMAGHDGVSMLDGGFAAWAASGQPVATGPDTPQAAPPYRVRVREHGRATLADVEQAVAGGSGRLLDARNRASFEGGEKSPQATRAGRLPGALHQEGSEAYDPRRNRLRSPDDLERVFAGTSPEGPLIPYCNTGQQAATNWFVLSEILGREDVRLYDGSMSEWTHDPARAVESGP